MRVSAYCSHVVCGRERAFKEVLGGEDGQEGLSRGPPSKDSYNNGVSQAKAEEESIPSRGNSLCKGLEINENLP